MGAATRIESLGVSAQGTVDREPRTDRVFTVVFQSPMIVIESKRIVITEFVGEKMIAAFGPIGVDPEETQSAAPKEVVIQFDADRELPPFTSPRIRGSFFFELWKKTGVGFARRPVVFFSEKLQTMEDLNPFNLDDDYKEEDPTHGHWETYLSIWKQP